MLRIHGSARSRALRVLWMTFELGIPYEQNDILPRSPATKTPEFLALNPNAQLPVIEDDGFVLSESMAINLYLAKKHKSPLYPSDPKQEAIALQWCLWETDKLDRQLVNYVNHSTALPPEQRDAAIANAAWTSVVPALDVLNGVLRGTKWLAGPEFSIADLNVAGALYRGLSMDLSRWPAIDEWLRRCWDRPAAKKARAMREG
jgi:glutathione S-transferase